MGRLLLLLEFQCRKQGKHRRGTNLSKMSHGLRGPCGPVPHGAGPYGLGPCGPPWALMGPPIMGRALRGWKRPSGSCGLCACFAALSLCFLLRCRFAFRFAFAFALLHFGFASLCFSLHFTSLSLRFSNRPVSNLDSNTPIGQRIVCFVCGFIVHVYMLTSGQASRQPGMLGCPVVGFSALVLPAVSNRHSTLGLGTPT